MLYIHFIHKIRAVFLLLALLCLLAGSPFAQSKLPFTADDTLDDIKAKIAHNQYSFTVGHNWVFDLPAAQKAKMFRKRQVPTPDKRILVLHSDALLGNKAKRAPAAFDWRNYSGHAYIGPVRNQQHLGSCYSFGACAAAESTYNFKFGLYDSRCADFAEMYIVWTLSSVAPYQDHFSGGNGADYEYYELFALTKSGPPEGAVGFEGVCYETAFPYSDSETSPAKNVIEASKLLPRVAFKQWGRVFPANYADTTDQIKAAISTYGAVDAAVLVSNAFVAYIGGVYEDTNINPDATPYYYTTTDHAISLVGWDDNPPEGGGGCWILRNSWGNSWGENGYMRIRYFSAVVNTEVSYIEAEDPAGSFSISGTVSGDASAGITIVLTGTVASSTTTAANGTYVLSGLADGTYTVTPTSIAYHFAPASQSVVIASGHQTGIDFSAVAVNPASVSGTVTRAKRQEFNPTGTIRVGMYADPDIAYAPAAIANIPAPGDYTIPGVLPGTYYAGAFQDVNGNGIHDAGEAFGFCPQQITVQEGGSAYGVGITLQGSSESSKSGGGSCGCSGAEFVLCWLFFRVARYRNKKTDVPAL